MQLLYGAQAGLDRESNSCLQQLKLIPSHLVAHVHYTYIGARMWWSQRLGDATRSFLVQGLTSRVSGPDLQNGLLSWPPALSAYRLAGAYINPPDPLPFIQFWDLRQ